jgi:hypothetical protein
MAPKSARSALMKASVSAGVVMQGEVPSSRMRVAMASSSSA